MLAGLVALSTLLRAWAGSRIPTPWINGDEVIYAELGRSLYDSGRLDILGRSTGFYSAVYPALVGLPLAMDDVARGYSVVKAAQALAMSVTAVPVYLWARTLMKARWAVVTAALVLTPPALVYSGLLMTEVAFYPVVVLAAWAMARALAAPTIGNQALAVGAIAVAAATRLQALVLVLVFPTALLLKAAVERTLIRDLRALAPALGGLVVLAGGWSAWQVAGGGATDVLGAYGAAGETSYGLGDAVRFIVWHAGDLVLVAGVIPVCAVALLFTRIRSGSADVRAYLAVTAGLALWFVVEVGVFASRHVGRLAERDLVALIPVLFVGFGIWLDRGAPRPRLWSLAVAGASAALLAYLPVARLVSRGALPDAFMLIPLYRLQVRQPDVDLDVFVLVGAAIALGLFLFVPRRQAWALAAFVGVGLAAVSISSSRVVAAEATLLRPDVLPAEKRWIDRAANEPAAYLYGGELHWNAVYENVFWNRRLREVRALPGFDIPGPIPQDEVVPQPDGRLVGNGRPLAGRYVAAAHQLSFFGTRVADAPEPRLALWRVVGPPRMSTWLTGMALHETASRRPGDFFARGDVGSHATLAVYGCRRGRLRLSIAVAGPTDVELLRNGRVARRFHFARTGDGWTGSLELEPSRRGPQCEFELVSSSLVHVTELALVRGARPRCREGPLDAWRGRCRSAAALR